MIEKDLVCTGFDFELLLGESFLSSALVALREGEILPTRMEIAGEPFFLLIRANADLLFEDLILQDWDASGQPTGQRCVRADLRVEAEMSFRQHNLSAGVYFTVDLSPNPDPTRISRYTPHLRLRFVALDGTTRAWIRDHWMDPTEVEAHLARAGDVNLGRDFLPPLVYEAELHKFAASAGRPACLGLYVNLPLKVGDLSRRIYLESDPFFSQPDMIPDFRDEILPPEPDDAPIRRGDTSLRQNFLAPDRDVAFAVPPVFFERLRRHLTHGYTERRDDGTFWRPLRGPRKEGEEKGPVFGCLDSMGVACTSGIIRVEAHVTIARLGGIQVRTDVDISPTWDDVRGLRWDVKVQEPEADVSFFESILGIATMGIAVLLAPLSFGVSLSFFAFTLGTGLAAIHIMKEGYEGDGQKMLQKSLASDGLTDALATLPARATIVRRRDDPFCEHLHQVVASMDDFSLDDQHIFVSGRVRFESHWCPVPSEIIDRRRLEEPRGELAALLIRAPHPETIRPGGHLLEEVVGRPGVFVLPVEEAISRASGGGLCVQERVYPEAIRVRGGSHHGDPLQGRPAPLSLRGGPPPGVPGPVGGGLPHRTAQERAELLPRQGGRPRAEQPHPPPPVVALRGTTRSIAACLEHQMAAGGLPRRDPELLAPPGRELARLFLLGARSEP